MITSTYFLCNDSDVKLLKINLRITHRFIGVLSEDDVEILTDNINILPGIIKDYLLTESSLKKSQGVNAYIHNCTLYPYSTGYILDDKIRDDLGFTDKLLINGRLDGLWPFRCLIREHFKCIENGTGFYFSSDRIRALSFTTKLAGFDKIFIDGPVKWKEI